MKVALLIAGEWRSHEIAFKSWKPIMHLNPDVYISTWNISEEYSLPLGIDIKREITETYISTLFHKSKISVNELVPYSSRFAKMLHNWRICLQMMIQSEIQYDSVILIRPDLYINPVGGKFYQTVFRPTANTVYSITDDPSYIQDQIFVSQQKEICKFVPNLETNLHGFEYSINGHVWLGNYLRDQGLKSDKIGGFDSNHLSSRFCIVRANCVNEDADSFEKIRYKAKIWWEINNPGLIYQG